MAQRPRILSIDDSHSVQVRYGEILNSIGADIDIAENGEEGLEKALAKNYDLILTDVRMPKMTGIELCHALQAVPKTRRVPVVIISNFDSENDIEQGFEAGAAAYLSKRDVHALLVKTVNECLRKSGHRQKRIILVVDDSLSIQRYVEMGLVQAGFQVLSAKNGGEALSLLETQKPDLILSDINMPEVDGFELCRQINADSRFSSIPLVVMSSSDDRIHMYRIMQFGAAGYVVKPFALEQLIGLIDRILSDQFLLLLKERDRLDSERTSLLSAVSKVVEILELKDPYSARHSQSVSKTTAEMLALTGASKADIESLALGARLHNIGNVGVRDSVLLKPWTLSASELAHVREHPKLGRRIIETVPSLSGVTSIVYSHHEKWDGAGYPEGLKKKDIPFWARLTAVADTYHALTSDRPFRSAYPEDRALDIIKDVRESQLCPKCVDLFFTWIEKR